MTILVRPARAALLAVAAFACTTNASAQLYKCEKDGRTSFQERPCESADRETRLDMPAGSGGSAWEGCYAGDLGKWGGGGTEPITMRVRRGARGLELMLGDAPEALPVHRMTEEERRREGGTPFRNSMGMRLLDGLMVEGPVDGADPSKGRRAYPILFRVQDASGRELLMTILPFTMGYLRQVSCTPR